MNWRRGKAFGYERAYGGKKLTRGKGAQRKQSRIRARSNTPSGHQGRFKSPRFCPVLNRPGQERHAGVVSVALCVRPTCLFMARRGVAAHPMGASSKDVQCVERAIKGLNRPNSRCGDYDISRMAE